MVQTHTHLLFLSLTPPLFLIFLGCSRWFLPLHLCPRAVCSSDKPSAEVVCFSLHAVPLAHCFTWRCSTNYLMRAGRPAWATAHCTGMKSVCSHRGGFSALVMGRASPLFSFPHHSFGKLISSSLWPAIIYSPVYFMAHFRISASLYVQANLHLQQCLYCVISRGFCAVFHVKQ